MLGFNSGDFTLVDESAFEELWAPKQDTECGELCNYCPDCNIPMEISGFEYKCTQCGYTDTKEDIVPHDKSDNVSGVMKISTGARRGRHYNVACDYSRTQRQVILEQLMRQHYACKGSPIPINILQAASNQYNNIQKVICEIEYDENGNVCGKKKFVRRGSIKDEVLAAILYFECIRENLMRKKKDIAAFMGLPTSGFARGEDILRTLAVDGSIDLPEITDPVLGFAERYVESLNLDNKELIDFICDIVNESEKQRICMTSQISSKVVGTIWVYITQKKLPITAAMLEKSADNIKKNTFTKFSTEVMKNKRVFQPIFKSYDVPY